MTASPPCEFQNMDKLIESWLDADQENIDIAKQNESVDQVIEFLESIRNVSSNMIISFNSIPLQKLKKASPEDVIDMNMMNTLGKLSTFDALLTNELVGGKVIECLLLSAYLCTDQSDPDNCQVLPDEMHQQ